MDNSYRTKAKEMNSATRGAIHALMMFGLTLGILFFVYPWSVYQENFDFPWQRTLCSYITLAVLTTVVCSFVPWWVTEQISLKLAVGGRLGIAAVFLGTCSTGIVVLVITFGGIGLGLDLPGTRIQGIFFSEWKFATFLLHVGIPLCAVATVLMLALQRRVHSSS